MDLSLQSTRVNLADIEKLHGDTVAHVLSSKDAAAAATAEGLRPMQVTQDDLR